MIHHGNSGVPKKSAEKPGARVFSPGSSHSDFHRDKSRMGSMTTNIQDGFLWVPSGKHTKSY